MGLARRTPWQLPTNLNPKEYGRCIQLLIPDDDEYERLLWNFIYDNACLTWMSWQRTGTRAGQDQVELWRRVLATWTHCQQNEISATGVWISPMEQLLQITKDTSGNCILQYRCCVDDPWITVANLGNLSNGQPGPGSGSTPPPGGSQQTCRKLNANQQLLIPALVSTGDTITLDSSDGAGYDGGEFDFGPVWRIMANGDQFVGGLDVGFPTLMSGDPVPTAPHMSLIAVIGATPVYLPLIVGVAAVVPSGVSNAQVLVQVNDSDISNNQGSSDICVTVKNNAETTWCYTCDFTKSPCGFFIASGSAATWVPGQGFVGTPGGSPNYSALSVELALSPATKLTSLEWTETRVGSSGPSSDTAAALYPSATLLLDAGVGTGGTHNWAGSEIDTNLSISVNAGSSGSAVLVSAILKGTGTMPSALVNGNSC